MGDLTPAPPEVPVVIAGAVAVVPTAATGAAIPPSLVRTLVPAFVALVICYSGRYGLGLSDSSGFLTQTVTVFLTGVYYTIVRILEVHVAPKFGWLLGYAKPPVYVAPVPVGTFGS